jgi:predicted heme/steroid binding protein
MSASSSAPGEATEQETDGTSSVSPRRYTRAELALHDGSDPDRTVLIAHKGKVYDVTGSFPWAKGSHWGELLAGEDHTGHFKEAIHGEEMLVRVPCVGVLID